MRRITKTVLVTCALFLLTGGAVGFAAAAGDDGTMAVDRPRPGDHAVYATEERYIGPHKSGNAAPTRIEYTWEDERWIMDGEFQLRLVHPLHVQATFFGGTDRELVLVRDEFYDAATGTPIVSRGEGAWLLQISNGGVMGTGVGAQSAAAEYRTDYYTGQRGACAMRTALHDEASFGEDLRMDGYCDYLDGADSLTYEYIGAKDLRGLRVHEYRDPVRPYFQAHYTSSHPFPVEFTSTLSNFIHKDFLAGRFYHMTLLSYARGDTTYTPLSESAIAPSPGLAEPQPREHLRTDSTGLDTLADFDTAWQAVLDDLKAPRIAEYLDTHPDAYLAASSYTESRESDGTLHGYWYFTVADGSSSLSKMVNVDPVVPERLGAVDLGYTLTVGDSQGNGWEFPHKDHIPSTVISIADQAERFRFFASNNERVNSVSYWVRCNPSCTEPETTMYIGHVDRSHAAPTSPLSMVEGSYYYMQLLRTTVEGGPFMFYNFGESYNPGVPLPGQQSAGPGGFNDGVAIASVWAPPSGSVAATFGFLALLGGALYHFWPAIKSATFLGGFSRIQGSQLLEHPGRARIMHVVENQPGIHFQALCRELDMAKGTMRHHLQKLEAEVLIRSKHASGRTCYVAAGVGREEANHAALLASAGTRQVYKLLSEDPGMATQDVAVHLGIAPSTVSYHRKKLRDAGLAA